MREGQYSLSEFQKAFVKRSHDVLIDNREIWSKSIVFKDSFEHKGLFSNKRSCRNAICKKKKKKNQKNRKTE